MFKLSKLIFYKMEANAMTDYRKDNHLMSIYHKVNDGDVLKGRDSKIN